MGTVQTLEVALKDGGKIVVRHATTADAEGLLALFRAVVEEGPWTLAQPDEAKGSVGDERGEIEKYTKDPRSVYLVACEGSEVIGTARAEAGSNRRTAHFADVHSVWVRLDARGRGIGDALMRVLVEWARSSEQIEKLGLFVFSTSEAAIGLYRKHGFVEEGRAARDMKFEDGSYAGTVILGHFLGD